MYEIFRVTDDSLMGTSDGVCEDEGSQQLKDEYISYVFFGRILVQYVIIAVHRLICRSLYDYWVYLRRVL